MLMCLYEKQIKMEQAVDVHTLVHKCTAIEHVCSPYLKLNIYLYCFTKAWRQLQKLNKINFFHSIQVFVKMTIFDEDRIVHISVHIQFNHIT